MKTGIGLMAALAVALLMAGCIDDKSSSPLEGTWFGAVEDSGGGRSTLTITVNNSGDIQHVSGRSGVTGTTAQETSQIFSFNLSDGTKGGFITDSSYTNASYLDDDLSFGALEKGAISLPIFSSTDIVGSWFGVAATTDFTTFDQFSSNAEALADLSVSGSDSDNLQFQTPSLTPDVGNGVWFGTFTNSVPESGAFGAFMSANRGFLATWACVTPSLGATPVCRYYGWGK